MTERVRSILEHMTEDARDAIAFSTQSETFEEFAQNPLYKKAIIMSIINIGELVKHLPDDFRSSHTEVPWRKISGMRDIAAHGYHIVDDEIVWDVVTESIPELLDFLRGILD